MSNYDFITEFIIKKLKEGIIPWKSPFRGHNHRDASWLTKKPYRGINVLMTSMMGKHSPYWMTFNQIKKMKDVHLTKGTKGTPIIFAKMIDYVDDDNNRKTKSIFSRSYVYNLQDIEGIECPVMKEFEGEEVLDFNPVEDCEKLLEEIKPNLCAISHIPDFRASYSSMQDRIALAEPQLYKTESDYYATLFHEIIHSTGHKSRCDRPLGNDKKSNAYAKEELIAEIGASFLCSDAGIIDETLVDSAAYIQGWIQNLKDDPMMIVQASSLAQKGIDYLKQ